MALVASVVAACASGGQPTTTAPVPASPTQDTVAPSAWPTPVPTPDVTAAAASACPSAATLRVHEYVTADPTCFGSRDVTLIAWLGALPAMGWEGPSIEPGWLIYPPNTDMSALWQRGPGGEPMCGGDPDCALLIVHLRPESTIVLGQSPRWVVATGHVRDPLSPTCRFDLGDDWPDAEPTPDNAVAREECSSQFVLTSLRDGAAPAEP